MDHMTTKDKIEIAFWVVISVIIVIGIASGGGMF